MTGNKMKLGIVGYGNMGSSMAEVLKNKFSLVVFDKDNEKTKGIKDLIVVNSLKELIEQVEVIILAVKPQDFKELLLQLKNLARDKLVVSIAAGVPIKFIEENLPQTRVIRVMPNLMVKIKKATSALVPSKFAQKKDIKLVKRIFKLMGKILILKEELIDAFTVISGSGPAFIYALIKEKSNREIKKIIKKDIAPIFYRMSLNFGFEPPQAKFLARNIINTSLLFLKKSGLSSDELIKKIASKGGTTEAGLLVLTQGGTLEEAIEAGVKRARELSKIF